MNESETLTAYSRGALSRSVTMAALGLSWYGDLLVLLSEHQIPRPVVSEEDARIMDRILDEAFGNRKAQR